MSFPSPSLVEQFRLQLPLVLAPMAGGPSSPRLAAAVANAGGLGSLGLAYVKPEEISSQVAEYRRQTSKTLSINLFVPTKDPVITAEMLDKALAATKKYRERFHLPQPSLKAPFSENFDRQFAAMLAARPEIFTFTFGVLDKTYLQACREENIYVMGTATTLEEAQRLDESGVDAIILQGFEGGGHRGIFDDTAEDPGIAALELTRICSEHIHRPLITAGGLMSGKDIAMAVKAGAQAAQLGTAFLLCDEAGTSQPYRQELLKKVPQRSRLTRVFSGRWARGLENQFMREMEEHLESILPFPAQNVFTRDLRKASAAAGSGDLLSLWAGAQADRLRPMKVADLMEIFKQEYEESL